eukprot:gb/GEZJ01002243.1/.p1 GENE.gb/GEZJ01002243.1/~~gb/GEZJ01002243.1/.p1  ORF type:complete len:111 (+),score=9.53 gb/GEZJ01002243.1/:1246-1578(+)
MKMLNISVVGGSAFATWWKDVLDPITGIAAAGVGVSSFIAESVESPIRSQCYSMQTVSIMLCEVGSFCDIDILWVPSHCGISIDYTEVGRRATVKQCARPLLPHISSDME